MWGRSGENLKNELFLTQHFERQVWQPPDSPDLSVRPWKGRGDDKAQKATKGDPHTDKYGKFIGMK